VIRRDAPLTTTATGPGAPKEMPLTPSAHTSTPVWQAVTRAVPDENGAKHRIILTRTERSAAQRPATLSTVHPICPLDRIAVNIDTAGHAHVVVPAKGGIPPGDRLGPVCPDLGQIEAARERGGARGAAGRGRASPLAWRGSCTATPEQRAPQAPALSASGKLRLPRRPFVSTTGRTPATCPRQRHSGMAIRSHGLTPPRWDAAARAQARVRTLQGTLPGTATHDRTRRETRTTHGLLLGYRDIGSTATFVRRIHSRLPWPERVRQACAVTRDEIPKPV
jgi:hypothetical protein